MIIVQQFYICLKRGCFVSKDLELKGSARK